MYIAYVVFGLGLIVLLVVFLFAVKETEQFAFVHRRIEALFKDIQKGIDITAKTFEAANQKFHVQTQFNAEIARAVEKLKKDFEVIDVRQRTMEKKIISSERTVNLVFGKPIPVQMETVTNKPPNSGAGQSALIRPGVRT